MKMKKLKLIIKKQNRMISLVERIRRRGESEKREKGQRGIALEKERGKEW